MKKAQMLYLFIKYIRILIKWLIRTSDIMIRGRFDENYDIDFKNDILSFSMSLKLAPISPTKKKQNA